MLQLTGSVNLYWMQICSKLRGSHLLSLIKFDFQVAGLFGPCGKKFFTRSPVPQITLKINKTKFLAALLVKKGWTVGLIIAGFKEEQSTATMLIYIHSLGKHSPVCFLRRSPESRHIVCLVGANATAINFTLLSSLALLLYTCFISHSLTFPLLLCLNASKVCPNAHVHKVSAELGLGMITIKATSCNRPKNSLKCEHFQEESVCLWVFVFCG